MILTAILIMLLTPLVVLGLNFSRLRTSYIWPMAMISTFISWGLILLSRNQIPISISLANWQPNYIFSASPVLLVDEISWYFAVATVTLPLAVLLTDVARVNELDPLTWASSQALGGVGLIAVIAGNPLTLLLAWAMIDIVESAMLLLHVTGSSEREHVVISFSIRIAGMIMLISAMLRAESLGMSLTFENIPSEVSGYLILAAGLRLGVLPPYRLYLEEQFMRRGLGTLIRFVPIATSVVLLARTAQVEMMDGWASVFMILAAGSAILSATAWVLAKNEIQGRPYWILGMGAFTLAAAVQGMSDASTAWGLATLFSGALLFLFSARHRKLLILSVFGAAGFSALPLSPTWEGSAFFIALPWMYRLVFLVALALMMIGYLRFAQQSGSKNDDFESWMWLVYPFGLALLPLTHYGLIYVKWAQGFREISFQSPWWWVGLIPLGLSAILILMGHRQTISIPPVLKRVGNVFDWFYRFLWWGYRALSRTLHIVTRLLEGEGSVLWMLLILILLIITLNLWGGEYDFEL